MLNVESHDCIGCIEYMIGECSVLNKTFAPSILRLREHCGGGLKEFKMHKIWKENNNCYLLGKKHGLQS